VAGWESVTRGRKGWGRVSRGVVEYGSRTKQSSKVGDVAVRVKGALGVGREGWGVIWPVGIEVGSRGRWWVVWRVTVVPSIVGEVGLRLK